MIDENNAVKTLVVNQSDRRVSRNVHETNTSVLDAFVQISNRSDSGFKRHVNKMQYMQKENNSEKINKIFEELEDDFGRIEKENNQSKTEVKNVVPRREYSDKIRSKSKLSNSQPELDRRFRFVRKRRSKVF